MSKSVKILLGLATLTPFVFTAVVLWFFFQLFNAAPAERFEEYFSKYAVMMNIAWFLFTIFFTAILVIFIIHAARNQILETNGMRTTWLISLCLLGAWVMPFYWFYYIWRDGVPRHRSGPLDLN